MIIYHAVTYYHILKFTLHKLNYHINDKAVLLVPGPLQRKCSGLFTDDTKKNIFSAVYFYNWHPNPPQGSKQHKIDEIDKQMAEWFGEGYMDEVSEINVCSAAYYFGVWLAEKKIKFNWFEEADGFLSTPYFLQNADRDCNKVRYNMAEELGLYTGENENIINKYVKVEAQAPGVCDENTRDFNVLDELKKLNEEQKSMLLSFFDVPLDLKFEKNSAIILTQHFVNMNMLTYEESALLYQLTTDYYLNDCKLYYKWHPTDITDYPDFMDGVTMVGGSFPSELLTIMANEPIKICGSIESSGTKNLASMCEKILLFDRDYVLNSWKNNNRYYLCTKIMELFEKVPFYMLGMNECHINNMLEFGDVNIDTELTFLDGFIRSEDNAAAGIYFIDKGDEVDSLILDMFYEKANDNDVYVFLNANNENCFWPIKDEMHCVVKEIEISALEQEKYGADVWYERVYIFSKNENMLERIANMKYVKELKQTGVKTVVPELQDKDKEIAILRGMLTATEAQLKKCVEENKILKGKL